MKNYCFKMAWYWSDQIMKVLVVEKDFVCNTYLKIALTCIILLRSGQFRVYLSKKSDKVKWVPIKHHQTN